VLHFEAVKGRLDVRANRTGGVGQSPDGREDLLLSLIHI